MQKSKVDLVGILKSLKDVNIRFNPRPFKNPIHLEPMTTPPTPVPIVSQPIQQVTPNREMFIQRHAEIVAKVDNLISQMDALETPIIDDAMIPPENDLELTPDKTISHIEKTF